MDKLIELDEIKVVRKILREIDKSLTYEEETDGYTGQFIVKITGTDREHLKNVVSKLNWYAHPQGLFR